MNEKTKQRIEEIRKRLEEYRKYQDDSCYYADQVAATRQLECRAPEDIEFLLNEVRRLRVFQTLRHSPSRVAEKLKK